MERRTFESPMDWEYQNSGPVDLTSPFTQVAKRRTENLFSSPSKPAPRNTLLSTFGTPSRPPQSSLFTPQISLRVAAPPFRNPAFTTPRKFDDLAFSEAEDSPAPTEASDFPNDTPEADRMGDMSTVGAITPLKIDKASRYGRSPRKHASGKGEIRVLRDSPRKELQVLRKRKRHNYDRDVSSVARHMYQDWDDAASDSDMSVASYARPPLQVKKHQSQSQPQAEGWFSYVLNTMEQHPSAPDNIYQWLQLGLNFSFISLLAFCGWSVVGAIRSDLRNANDRARMEIMSRISECQNHYTTNECAKRDRPALRVMCDEWYDCMTQDADAIMRVKVTARQLAEIINEFTDAMNMKAWAFFFALALFVVFANFMLRYGSAKAQTVQSHPPVPSHVVPMVPDITPAHPRARFETPRSQRYGLLDDDATDTDASPPKLRPLLVGYTPSGRRSPSKGERSRSPVKNHRSPSKGY